MKVWLVAGTALVVAVTAAILITRSGPPESDQIVEQLLDARFEQRVIDGYRVDRAYRGSDEFGGTHGSVVILLNETSEPDNYEGPPMLVAYNIMRDEAAALAELEKVASSEKQTSREVFQRAGFFHYRELDLAKVSRPHWCSKRSDGFSSCLVVVRNIVIDAQSNIELLHLDDVSHVQWLARTALRHLEQAIPELA